VLEREKVVKLIDRRNKDLETEIIDPEDRKVLIDVIEFFRLLT